MARPEHRILQQLSELRRKVRLASEVALKTAAQFPMSRDIMLQRVVQTWLDSEDPESSVIAYACAAELRLQLEVSSMERCGRLVSQSAAPALQALYWSASRRHRPRLWR